MVNLAGRLALVLCFLMVMACGNDSQPQDTNDAGTVEDSGVSDAEEESDVVEEEPDVTEEEPDATDEPEVTEEGEATGESRVDPELWERALTDWETNMVERGTSLGEKFLSESPADINNPPYPWYYDSARAFFQIGDYLGDPDGTWSDYGQAAAEAYREYIDPNYGMPGYERFSQGLAMDYLRNDDA